jgi:hypothetical protein
MATTYSPSLTLAYIGTGDQSGTWGATTNTNLGLIEQAITGVTSISLSGTSYTLVPLNGVSDVPRNMVLVFGGTPSGNVTVTAPLVQKFYVITNNTAYNIIMAATGGSISLTIPSGITAQCYCDGSTGFYSAQTGSAGNFLVNGNLNVTGNTADVGNLSVTGTASLNGTSTAVTPTLGDNTTKIATTAFVTTAVNTATGSLGTMSTQNANNVAIIGGSINGTTIGASTAAAGTFTTVVAATQFTGPGTGLTGTASSLNIGGNAAGTAGGLSGTPNISVGTIASGAQTVTGYTGTSPSLALTTGVSVYTNLNAIGPNTMYLNGYGLNTSGNLISLNLSYGNFGLNNLGGALTYGTLSAPTITSTVATGTAPLTVTSTTPVANLSVGGSSTKIANTGGWSITPTGTKLYFNYNGTNVGSLDSSGNFIVTGNITAYGTP